MYRTSFFLSPLKMRSFVDQFHSPWVGTHFDTGNVMPYGYPEDWILTLGQRIERIHFKDCKLSTLTEPGRSVDLLQGDVKWKAGMAALVKIGYNGFISPEIGHDPSQPGQLNQISRRWIKLLSKEDAFGHRANPGPGLIDSIPGCAAPSY